MKYKVLLTGNNQAMFDEFFIHMAGVFECQTCSSRYEDILSHILHFEPNIFVYCMNRETPETISAIHSLHGNFKNTRTIISIIGDTDDCFNFSQPPAEAPDLVLTRPITASKIQEQLFRFAESRHLLTAAEKVNENTESKTESASSRKHILVVDDDARMLKLIKTYLIEQYDVATAISGKVALKFLETKKTDLVLLDYEMPQQNGADVLEMLRLNPDTMDLPVIFLTGVSDSDRIQKVLSLHPQGYLLKPVSRSKLFASIRRVFGTK